MHAQNFGTVFNEFCVIKIQKLCQIGMHCIHQTSAQLFVLKIQTHTKIVLIVIHDSYESVDGFDQKF